MDRHDLSFLLNQDESEVTTSTCTVSLGREQQTAMSLAPQKLSNEGFNNGIYLSFRLPASKFLIYITVGHILIYLFELECLELIACICNEIDLTIKMLCITLLFYCLEYYMHYYICSMFNINIKGGTNTVSN